MCALAAIGIHDDFAAGESRVAVRAADDELARGVHVVGDGVVEQGQYLFGVDGCLDTRHQHLYHVAAYGGQHLGVRLALGLFAVVLRLYEFVVLRGDHDGIYAYGHAVVVILYGHLALGVGTKVGHVLAFAPDVGEHLQNAVRQVERQRHVVLRLVGGVAEHHSLVARALFHGVFALYSAVDVGTLLVYGAQHAARVAFEHVFALGVAHLLDDLAGNERHVHVGLGLHFAGQDDLPSGDERLAGHLRLGVVSQQFVEHGVRYLVGHFVGVSFRHRFGCKQISHF